MRAARRARLPEPDQSAEQAQPSLFPQLPPPARVQPAVRLTESNVARTVPPGIAGVYFLKSVARGGRVSERVGRDDVDLRQRLLGLATEAGENVLFGWLRADNPFDAYRLECYLWHAQGGAWASIQGDAHPQPAERIPFLGCPDCED